MPTGTPSCSLLLLLVLWRDILVVRLLLARLAAAPALAAVGVLVHRLSNLHRALLERLDLLLERLGRDVLLADRLLDGGDVGGDLVLVLLRHLGLVLQQRLLGLVHERVRLVPRLDDGLAVRVRRRVRLRLAHHALDVRVGEAARGLDLDLLRLARRLVLGRHVDDAVGVDVKGHLDLRHASRRRRDAHEVELAEHLVVGGHLALALQHLDADLLLVVGRGGEGLRLLGWDGGVSADELGHHAAERLDPERERRHIEQQDVLDVAAQHAALDGGAERHDLVGVHALEGLFAEEARHNLLHLWHPSHPAHQNHLVDLARRDARILEARLARRHRPLDQAVCQRLEVGAGHLVVHVLWAGRVGGDEGQRDVGLQRRRQLGLCLLGGLAQPLHRELVARQVDALLLFELGGEVVEQRDVEVLAAEQRVAVGRLDLEDAARDLEDRDVKGAAAQVVHGNHLAVLLVHAVGERGGGRLVDDTQHLESGNLARVLGRLPLRVVEIRRHGHHRVADGAAEVRLGRLLHLPEDKGARLRWRVALPLHLEPRVAVVRPHDVVRHRRQVLLHVLVVKAPADEALCRKERPLRVGHRLPLGGRAHQPLAVAGEGDHRRRRPRALRILHHLWAATLHERDAAVGRAEVDADDGTHRP
mmetsp:Transcript_32391/g.96486  ORF Transcript_32391/g.96486 Transcript_32391/m.96486 type:complete len:645 (+) Transcript_32391:236-2170(+)